MAKSGTGGMMNRTVKTRRSAYFPNPTSHAVPRNNGTADKTSCPKPFRTGNSYGNRPAVKKEC